MPDREQYPSYFHPKKIGRSLIEVSTSSFQEESPHLKSRWFHSAWETDLFIWKDLNDQIVKQQVAFYGQVVEWNIIEGLKTGLVSEGRRRGGSEIIQFDKTPQAYSVKMALEVIRHVKDLNDIEKQQLINNFANPPPGIDLDPEEFMRRYGRSGPSKNEPVSIWQALWGWIRRLFF